MSFEGPSSGRYGLHQCSPQAVLLSAVVLLVCASFCQRPLMLLGIFSACALAAIISRANMPTYFLRAGAATAVFALPVGLAAVAGAGFSGLGAHARVDIAGLLILRGLVASSICMLLVQSNGWQHIITGLRNLKAPSSFTDALMIAGIQIELLGRGVTAMSAGRRMRLIARPSVRESARSVGIRSTVLLSRSLQSAMMVEAALNARCIAPTLPRLNAQSSFKWIDAVPLGLAAVMSTGCVW